jgi:predicted ABC-type ATPase
MSNLYIICGPNGAGKTTASFSILPEILECKEFVNADEIARGLSPFNPEKVSISAGKLMLQRMNELLASNQTFAFETTLATKSYINLIRKALKIGYNVNIVFFALESEDLAVERVKYRVSEGGHNVEEKTIRRRYYSGLKNFFEVYKDRVPNWIFVENSGENSNIAARKENNSTKILEKDLWNFYKTKMNERRKR